MGEDEFTDRGGTIPQRLLMMNGEMVRDRTRQNPVILQNASARVANFATSNDQAVEVAYLIVLSRRPTANELSHFRAVLPEIGADERGPALEDLCWVLINSSEFCWNH